MSTNDFETTEYKNKHVPVLIFIFLLLIIACLSIGFKLGKKSTELNSTDNVIATTVAPDATDSAVHIDLIDLTTPEYQIVMPEKPEKSMSEFLIGLNKNKRMTIAYLHTCIENPDKSYLRSTYLIDMFLQESMLSNERIYFIEIDRKVTDGMSNDSLIIKFDESNIDEIWSVITKAIDEYNENARKRNNGEIEYDKETWVDVFEMIELHLTNAEIEITEKIDGIVIIDP